MGSWKGFTKWLENKIFPETDSKETRTAKSIALYSIIGSAILTIGGTMIGVGISIVTLGFSFQAQYITSTNSTTQDQIFF